LEIELHFNIREYFQYKFIKPPGDSGGLPAIPENMVVSTSHSENEEGGENKRKSVNIIV
jgi:hypothetical protein